MNKVAKALSKRRLYFRFLALISPFLVGELLASVLVGRPVHQPAPQLVMVYHPVLGFISQPNFSGYSLDQNISLNAEGFRFDLPDEPGKKRVVAIGDSFLFGQGVSREHTFAHLLSQQGEDYINLGVPGYDTRQEVDTLIEFGFKYNPTDVHLHFYGNDVYANSSPETFVNMHETVRRDRYANLRISALLTFLGKAYRTTLDRHNVANRLVRLTDPSDAQLPDLDSLWQETFLQLNRLAELCRKRDVDLMVVIHPIQGQTLVSANRYQKKLIPYLNKQGIAYLDLRGVLRSSDYIPMDGHYNEEGHRQVYYFLKSSANMSRSVATYKRDLR